MIESFWLAIFCATVYCLLVIPFLYAMCHFGIQFILGQLTSRFHLLPLSKFSTNSYRIKFFYTNTCPKPSWGNQPFNQFAQTFKFYQRKSMCNKHLVTRNFCEGSTQYAISKINMLHNLSCLKTRFIAKLLTFCKTVGPL